jgi:hypothetical protein
MLYSERARLAHHPGAAVFAIAAYPIVGPVADLDVASSEPLP